MLWLLWKQDKFKEETWDEKRLPTVVWLNIFQDWFAKFIQASNTDNTDRNVASVDWLILSINWIFFFISTYM